MTVSQHSKADIVKILGVPEKKVIVIYNTVPRIFLPHLDDNPESHHPFHKEQDQTVKEFTEFDWSKFTQNEKLKGLKDFVLYVGDATWNKNLVNMAKAIKIANVPCVCIGKIFDTLPTLLTTPASNVHPWQKELYEFAKEVQNDPRFIFPGYITDIELLQLYKQAKANLLLSFDEGFGFSFVEAAYLSTPSVLSNTPILREIAKNDANFASRIDPKDISQRIVELYYDPIKKEKLSISAFARANDFSPMVFRNGWIQLLEAVSR